MQEAPSNTNVAIRVASPGDNGAVTQLNTAAATATSTGSPVSGTGDATALATQTAPSNTNVSVRIQSPGADGVITQQSTSTQSTQAGAANAPVSVATTGAGNEAIAIRLGDTAATTPDARLELAVGLDLGLAVRGRLAERRSRARSADCLVGVAMGRATPPGSGPEPGAAPSARAPEAAAAGTAGPALAPGNGGAAAQTGWQWTWTWEWQRDDQTAWSWDWSWSQPCDCSWSWDWDWNWDWRTPAPVLNGTGAPPVPAGATVDPTVPLVANGPPRAADAAQVVLGPVAQANTAEASAAAGAQNQVTRITLTVANAQSPDIVQQVGHSEPASRSHRIGHSDRRRQREHPAGERRDAPTPRRDCVGRTGRVDGLRRPVERIDHCVGRDDSELSGSVRSAGRGLGWPDRRHAVGRPAAPPRPGGGRDEHRGADRGRKPRDRRSLRRRADQHRAVELRNRDGIGGRHLDGLPGQ